MSISGISAGPAAEDQGLALLKLMADPAALAAKIAEYERVKTESDTAIARVGDADKIVELRAEAVRLRDEAREIAENAAKEAAELKAQAKTVLDEAKKKAALIADQSKKKAEEAALAASTVIDSAERKRSEADLYSQTTVDAANALLKKANAEQSAANDAMAAAKQLADDAMAKKSAYEKKLRALSDLAKGD